MRSNQKNRESRHRYGDARARADKKQSQNSFSATYLKLPDGAKFFKPKAGVMLIDILPYAAGKGNPSAEEGVLWYERTFYLHPRIGADRNAYLCPRLTCKKNCPVCEARARWTNSDSEEKQEMAKEFAPKERQLFNVINRKDPEAGVLLWEMSYHNFGKALDARIRNADEDENWDKFFMLEGGMTLRVGFKEDSFAGRAFLVAETIDFKERDDYDEDILEKVYCLDDLLITPKYEDLKDTFLEASSKPKDEEEEESDEDNDSDEQEEEEDEKPRSKKSKGRVVEEEDEEEEESDDDDSDDSDEDEDEKPSKKKSSKRDEEEEDSDDDDSDDSDDDDSNDDDEEDEKPSKKSSKKSKDEEEEDNDDGDNDSDDSDEDEEEKPRSKNKKAPKEEDDDWGDFEEDEEDKDDDTDADGKPRVHAHHVHKKKR